MSVKNKSLIYTGSQGFNLSIFMSTRIFMSTKYFIFGGLCKHKHLNIKGAPCDLFFINNYTQHLFHELFLLILYSK